MLPGGPPGMGGMPPKGPMGPGMPGMGGPPPPPPGLGMGGARPPQGPFGVGMPPGMPGQGMPPGGPGGNPVLPPGQQGATQVLVGQCAQMLQQAIKSQGDPMSPVAARLQKVQQELAAISMDLPGSLHPLGPGTPSGAFGAGPEGANPMLRQMPDQPPPGANMSMFPRGGGGMMPPMQSPGLG